MEPVRASTSGGLPPALRVLAVALALLWGLLATPAADAATPADLGVTISKLTLTTPDKSGVVTLSGTVSNRSVKIGQSVSAGQALLTLLPAGDRLEAELLVPSESIGFIAPGDRVLLRYDAYPYQRFGVHTGNIVRI